MRGLRDCGLMDSSINTTIYAVCGYLQFAHIDRIIYANRAVYARLPKMHSSA